MRLLRIGFPLSLASLVIFTTISCEHAATTENLPPQETQALTFIYPHKSLSDFTNRGSPGQVFAKGKWALVTSTSTERSLPKANSVNIYCDKSERKCSEVVSLVWTSTDSKAFGSTPYLDVSLQEYSVVEWSPTLIKARTNLMGAEGEQQISVPSKTATRSWRARADSGSPDMEEFVLE
jgi:hypothetical protein